MSDYSSADPKPVTKSDSEILKELLKKLSSLYEYCKEQRSAGICHPDPIADSYQDVANKLWEVCDFREKKVATPGHGLIRIYWKSGGSSVAAVGTNNDGTRWLAPTNWVSPSRRWDDHAKDIERWEMVEAG